MTLSIVIPVHNESNLLSTDAIPELVAALDQSAVPYEIVVCENGSTDDTLRLAKGFQDKYTVLKVLQIETPDYGLALKHAIKHCQHDVVVIFNMDLCSASFVQESMPLLQHYDMVIGSKAMPGSDDRRPLARRIITRSFNGFLRLFYGFRGTDTHGLKAFKRERLGDVVAACVTDHFILDTELILRAQRKGLFITEIPIYVEELRQPSYASLLERAPKVLWNLIKLWFALRKYPR